MSKINAQSPVLGGSLWRYNALKSVLRVLSPLAFFVLAFVQAAASELRGNDTATLLDPGPFLSLRAVGMGGALSTLADGVHAPYYNPAGIGGLQGLQQERPLLRQLHLPYVAVGANDNTLKLRQDYLRGGGSQMEKATDSAILGAHAGKRQFGRASSLFSTVLSRAMLIQYEDMQVAGVPEGPAEVTGEQELSLAYRALSGTGLGLSFTDPKGQVYLGAFTALQRLRYVQNKFTYTQIANKNARRAAVKEQLQRYEGVATNVGLLWVLTDKKARPTLGLVSKNIGATKYQRQNPKAGQEAAETTLTEKQNLVLGFSLSPRLGALGLVNFIIEAEHLTEREVSFKKKVRTGLELTFGGVGSDARLGLRGGYSSGGASAGLSVNLDLIQLELASQSEDIGVGNTSIEERRILAVFSVNVLNE